MSRYTSETDAGLVTTTTQGRMAALEPDVWVPALQAGMLGLAIGASFGTVTLLLGGPVAGLRGVALWGWAGRLAGIAGVTTWAYATVRLVIDHRRLLWALETNTGKDLDNDGHVGKPSTVRVELIENKGRRQRFVDLPISDAQLYAVAQALASGASFSRPALVDHRRLLSQNEFHKLAKKMVKSGLARDLPGNQRELTGAGRAMVRRVLEQ